MKVLSGPRSPSPPSLSLLFPLSASCLPRSKRVSATVLFLPRVGGRGFRKPSQHDVKGHLHWIAHCSPTDQSPPIHRNRGSLRNRVDSRRLTIRCAKSILDWVELKTHLQPGYSENSSQLVRRAGSWLTGQDVSSTTALPHVPSVLYTEKGVKPSRGVVSWLATLSIVHSSFSQSEKKWSSG